MELKFLSPILWTKDLEETISFYEKILDFTSKSNFPNFASLTRDRIEIMIVVPQDEPEECKDDYSEEFFPKPLLTGSLYITIHQVDEFWEQVKEKAIIQSPIANREYRMRDFSILDNNGYELVFGEPVNAI